MNIIIIIKCVNISINPLFNKDVFSKCPYCEKHLFHLSVTFFKNFFTFSHNLYDVWNSLLVKKKRECRNYWWCFQPMSSTHSKVNLHDNRWYSSPNNVGNLKLLMINTLLKVLMLVIIGVKLFVILWISRLFVLLMC